MTPQLMLLFSINRTREETGFSCVFCSKYRRIALLPSSLKKCLVYTMQVTVGADQLCRVVCCIVTSCISLCYSTFKRSERSRTVLSASRNVQWSSTMQATCLTVMNLKFCCVIFSYSMITLFSAKVPVADLHQTTGYFRVQCLELSSCNHGRE